MVILVTIITVTGKENAGNVDKILDQQGVLILVDALIDKSIFDLDNDIIHADKKLICKGLKKKDFKISHEWSPKI